MKTTFSFLLWLHTLSVFSQTIRYVSSSGTNTNPASATSWATSASDLQGVVDNSMSGDQVWVKIGLYKPTTLTGPESQTISFGLKNGVIIYGGFIGNEISLSQRPAINPVIGIPSNSTLSGEIGNLTTASDNSYHVIYNAPGLTNTAVLDGFVITRGNSIGSFKYAYGGGMYNEGFGKGNFCSPTIRNCFFYANSNTAIVNNGGEGGISNPGLINCVFMANSGFLGGAILNRGSAGGTSSPTVINCSFQANTASYGGAIYNNGRTGVSNPILTNCSFQSNSVVQYAGAVFNDGGEGGISNPAFTECSFTNNSTERNGDGGAIYNYGYAGNSNPTLTNCIFHSNSANLGGAMYNHSNVSGNSNPGLTNCLFQNNSANIGGAMYNDAKWGTSSPSLTNCVFLANRGNLGGAIYNSGYDYVNGVSSPRFNRCLFQANTALYSGGAMYNSGQPGISSPILINCSFQDNSAAWGGAMYNEAIGGTSSPELTNCSFQRNSANAGSVMYNRLEHNGYTISNSKPSLQNCVLFSNGNDKVFFGHEVGSTKATVSVRYSLYEPSTALGRGFISVVGNFTTTTSPFTSTAATRLAANSLAIDTGEPTTSTTLVGTLDLAENPRFINSTIDMGAYEFQDEMFTNRIGDWNDPTIWNMNRIPQFGDRVRLKHAITIRTGSLATCTTLLFDPASKLIYEAGGRLQVGL